MKKYSYLLGRWLGDGCKTVERYIIIARNNTTNEIESMEYLANKVLNTTFRHFNKQYVTIFNDTNKINSNFKNVLEQINKGDYSFVKKFDQLKIIAGFLDSDGSVDNHSLYKDGNIKIKITLYNNNIGLLNFMKWILENHKMKPILKESYHQITNMGVVDNCWRLHINKSIDLYYVGSRIFKHMLHQTKRKRIENWLKYYKNTNNKRLNGKELI